MLVFTMAFHTYLASVVAQARNKEIRVFGKDKKDRVKLPRTQVNMRKDCKDRVFENILNTRESKHKHNLSCVAQFK